MANHIGLIIFPVILDLFLWFGPHFRLQQIFQNLSQQISLYASMNGAQMAEVMNASREFWEYLAARFNLASMLRTYPVGVPSLMSGRFPSDNPLGEPAIFHVGSLGNAMLLFLLFTVVGMVVGSLYFDSIARVIEGHIPRKGYSPRVWMASQAILLALAWMVLLILLNIPAILLLSLMALLAPGMAQLATLLYSIFAIWVLVPLLFSPHGIFLYRQNAIFSMLTSVRLMRYILPGTGFFFVSLLVLSQGMDILWQVPPTNSWMSLIGVGGHAFITTSLLAASFIYYRDAMRWVQEYLSKRETAGIKA